VHGVTFTLRIKVRLPREPETLLSVSTNGEMLPILHHPYCSPLDFIETHSHGILIVGL
jgi:hypothetical protein